MIYLEIRNDGAGTTGPPDSGGTASYDVRLFLPGLGEVTARVEDYDRTLGWAELVREATSALEKRQL